jgi:hypothetical protein
LKWENVDNKANFKTYKASHNDIFITGAEVIGKGSVKQYREILRDLSVRYIGNE